MKPATRSIATLVAGLSLAAASGGRAGESFAAAPQSQVPTFGLDAPLLSVDRFSERAGTLLRRSAVAGLPAPNEAIDLDRPPFLVGVRTPDGSLRSCYDFDLRPAEPATMYVFYDSLGQYVITQFPVVDVAPGDPGYTDLWRILKVTIPNGQPRDNSIRDADTVRRLLADASSGYSSENTQSLLNGPIVPEGSHGQWKADDRPGSVVLRYAWYRGKRAPYLYFEQSLVADPVVPVSTMKFEQAAGSPPAGALTAGSIPSLLQSAIVSVGAAPMSPGYSPLHTITDSSGKPLFDRPLNCPVVGNPSAPPRN
jgi:hypothetical protein